MTGGAMTGGAMTGGPVTFSPTTIGEPVLRWRSRARSIEGIEQELSRPYVYIDRRFQPTGFDIVNIKDPAKFEVAVPLHDASGKTIGS